VLALAAGSASGCASNEDAERERRRALVVFVEGARLEAVPGDATVRLSRVQSKNDDPYFVATGVLAEDTREAGLARVAAVLERQGWTVLETRGDSFLGACLRAEKGSMMLRTSVGWSTRSGFNPYPRLPGRVYVQTSVGREGSNQAWTDPDRPACDSA
jgi:hypothetical protein